MEYSPTSFLEFFTPQHFAIKAITSVFHFITFLLVLYPEEGIIAETSIKTLSNSVDRYNFQIQ